MRTGLQDFDHDRAPSALDEAEAIFTDAGWDAGDARWLAEACFDAIEGLDRDASELTSGERMVIVQVVRAAEIVEPESDRDGALLHALARLIGDGPSAQAPFPEIKLGEGIGIVGLARPDAERCAALARTWRQHGCEFERAIARGWSPGAFHRRNDPVHVLHDEATSPTRANFERHWLVRTMCALVAGGGLDLRRTIDRGAILEAGLGWAESNPAKRQIRGPSAFDGFPPCLSDPVAWMIVLGPGAIGPLVEDFHATPNAEHAAAFIGGIREAFDRWLYACIAPLASDPRAVRGAADALRTWLDAVEQRLGAFGAPHHPGLRECWLWLARSMVFLEKSAWDRLEADRHRTILAAATEDLARVRPLLESATPKPEDQEAQEIVSAVRNGVMEPPAWLVFEQRMPHLDTCIHLLVSTGTLWKGMKPLLLAVRRMGCPCVASDLRYWTEVHLRRPAIEDDPLEQPPEPWVWLPRVLVNLVHQYARAEQNEDEHLLALRGEFALFCLERLGDRLTEEARAALKTQRLRPQDKDMFEKSPIWRDGFVRAALALHINPKGKGDKILKRVAEDDPNQDVRRIAHDGRQRLRRGAVLPENKSPRRAVLEAFWWLRLAHLLELKHKYELNPALAGAMKIEIDHDGAQRTRAKELDRTREART